MPNKGIQGDIQRSKEYRAQAQQMKDPMAKQDLLDAADRLEKLAGKKARRVGRRRKRNSPPVRETR